ncbi:MAG: putative addiction module antidote protein [Armatimonadetes bacterium]|nr:putative addiction module antidote protein [Armatimonadota bacterium]
MRLLDFDVALATELRDREFAAAFLEAAVDEGLDAFLAAVGHIVRANGGMTQCARETGLSREALHRMLRRDGNPELRSVAAVLRARGLVLGVRTVGTGIGDGAEEPAPDTAACTLSVPAYVVDSLSRSADAQGVSVERLAESVLAYAAAALEKGAPPVRAHAAAESACLYDVPAPASAAHSR